ncbi:unnamed protein product [Peniophora sp. CBMAI 1063]|nr:unnamed protein product [Peniophora sp. CBMAI 1063]
MDAPTAAACTAEFSANKAATAAMLIQHMATKFAKACDNLIIAKADQAVPANKKCAAEHNDLDKGSLVMLSTYHHCHEYVSTGEDRVAKFFPHWGRPYRVTQAHPELSTYTLEIPKAVLKACLTFHSSLVKPYIEPNPNLVPDHTLPCPGPDANSEHIVCDIIAERRRSCGKQYKVRWEGYGDTDMEWLPGSVLKNNTVLDAWEAHQCDLKLNNTVHDQQDDAPVATVFLDCFYPPCLILK